MQLRKEYNQNQAEMLTSKQLAEAAGVPLADEFQMEIGGWVSTDILLPEGSRKYRLVCLNTLHETRYRIVLPDGYVLVETHHGPLDRWTLGFYPTREERATLEKEMREAGEYGRRDCYRTK
jgi:hypothetical protein